LPGTPATYSAVQYDGRVNVVLPGAQPVQSFA